MTEMLAMLRVKNYPVFPETSASRQRPEVHGVQGVEGSNPFTLIWANSTGRTPHQRVRPVLFRFHFVRNLQLQLTRQRSRVLTWNAGGGLSAAALLAPQVAVSGQPRFGVGREGLFSFSFCLPFSCALKRMRITPRHLRGTNSKAGGVARYAAGRD